jgi:hypothetical protein
MRFVALLRVIMFVGNSSGNRLLFEGGNNVPWFCTRPRSVKAVIVGASVKGFTPQCKGRVIVIRSRANISAL